MDSRKFYYFGCENDRSGHYLFDAEWHHVHNLPLKPFSLPTDNGPGYYKLDSGYAFKDRSEPQGIAAVHVLEECTVIAFWDRSVDRRGKSNSAFIAEGHRTFDEVIETAKERFPNLIARFKFEIRQGSWEDHRPPRKLDPSLYGIC